MNKGEVCPNHYTEPFCLDCPYCDSCKKECEKETELDLEFVELENHVYKCLYDQGISDIYFCKYFDECQVCKEYIKGVENKYPLIEGHIDKMGFAE